MGSSPRNAGHPSRKARRSPFCRPPRSPRGARKLSGALDDSGSTRRGAWRSDVGASTGGFTDCLLRRAPPRLRVDVGSACSTTAAARPRRFPRKGELPSRRRGSVAGKGDARGRRRFLHLPSAHPPGAPPFLAPGQRRSPREAAVRGGEGRVGKGASSGRRAAPGGGGRDRGVRPRNRVRSARRGGEPGPRAEGDRKCSCIFGGRSARKARLTSGGAAGNFLEVARTFHR